MMPDLYSQLILVATVTLLAVISPGPDFAIITRNSVSHGRKAGLFTAMGIAGGVLVHISYTLLGLGIVLSKAAWLLDVMRYAGAAYLLWLGISAFLNKQEKLTQITKDGARPAQSAWRHFRNGFLCNALNPKTALFFIALFSQAIDPATPLSLQAGFGAFIMLAHLLWFTAVALFLTHNRIKQIFDRAKTLIERIVGTCLIGLSAKLILSE